MPEPAGSPDSRKVHPHLSQIMCSILLPLARFKKNPPKPKSFWLVWRRCHLGLNFEVCGGGSTSPCRFPGEDVQEVQRAALAADSERGWGR